MSKSRLWVVNEEPNEEPNEVKKAEKTGSSSF